MRKCEKKTLGGLTYSVTALGAVEGRRVLARLIKLAGPVVEKIAGTKGGEGLASFAGIAQAINPEDLDYFCDAFMRMTQVQLAADKTVLLADIFDDHFASNYGVLIQWLAFCLEVNFGSFFGEGSLGNLGAALASG